MYETDKYQQLVTEISDTLRDIHKELAGLRADLRIVRQNTDGVDESE